ncbi:hypothetical protein KIPB_010243, partial [Kipferlia bialata]
GTPVLIFSYVKGIFPVEIAGTSVGLINTSAFIGCALMQLAAGILLENDDAILGHRDVFIMSAGFCLLAGICAVIVPDAGSSRHPKCKMAVYKAPGAKEEDSPVPEDVTV